MQDEPEQATGISHKMSLGASSGMLGIDHQHGRTELSSLGQMEAFLAGSVAMEFAGRSRDEVYAWTGRRWNGIITEP